jgi:uroporphyrinogen decarboxylase
MNVVERYRAAFLGNPVDRVPICAWLGLPLLSQLTGKSARAVLEEEASDPSEIVRVQEELGLDPIIVTIDDRWFSQHLYWRLLCSWPAEALATWHVKDEVTARNGPFVTHRFTAQTPDGLVTWSYETGMSKLTNLEYPIKQESDLELLRRYLPDPGVANLDNLAALVRKAGDRAFMVHNFLSVWGEAVNMRGFSEIAMDLADRPGFVHSLCEFLKQRALRRVERVAQTGVHSIIYDHSWLGTGYSAATYREFMQPHDIEVIRTARNAGLLVSFHNCGRGMHILEDMVSTGPHALETLSPKEISGDFDLAEVKRRVGDRVTLNGGLSERILTDGTPESIREAVKHCLAAAGDSRYILRTCGQIFQAAIPNIRAFTEAGHEYGRA